MPKEMHGLSLRPLFLEVAGKLMPWRDAFLYEYFEFPDSSHLVNKNRGIRTAKWKYIHYYEPPFQFAQEYELYDLEKDPEERVNLYRNPQMKPVIEELKKKMNQLRTESGDKME
jgi:arylsulfatase A-like enzyme